MDILYGLHPVEEALRSGSRKFDHLCIARERHDQRLQKIIDSARENAVRLRFEPREELTRLARTAAHQGVVAVVRTREFLDLEDLLANPEQSPEPRLLLALDGIEDPQNLGALLRTADASGVDGVILTERRAAPLSPVAVKASAGAAEHVRIARVVNLVRALEQLKQQNIWCVGLDERGTTSYDQYDFSSNTVVVLGREGSGLHDLVRRTCDHLLRIPMAGAVSSLNVSAAGAVVLFEAARQRRAQIQTRPTEAAPRKKLALCCVMLLLACLNLASLLMARSAARERELATRLAVGATRGRLIQQLLMDSLLLAALGAGIGLLVAPIVSQLLARFVLNKTQNGVLDTALDLRVLLFAVLIAFAAAIVVGLVPALRATSGNLNDWLKDRSRTAPARDRHRLWLRGLMGLEVALALILVIGCGLLATSLVRLYRTGLGFDPNGLVNLELSMDKQPLQGEALIHWYQQFGQALKRQPGVRNVSFEDHIPLSESMMAMMFRSPFNKGENILAVDNVAPNYFATMHIPLFAGREFRWTDKPDQGVVILNQAAAKALYPGKNPIGQQVTGVGHTYQVVGVAGDTKYMSVKEPARPEVYLPITQATAGKGSYTAVVRIDGPAAPLATEARSLLAKLAPDVPAPVMTTMNSELNESISSQRMMAMLSVFFAVIALLVTAIGLYGVLAYSTARRTNEIGVRMALGARRPQVVALVFRENLWSVLAGCAFGLAAALLAAHTLASFLYGISPRDPWVLSASLVLLCLVAAVASLIPALRAASIDPMEALRCE